VRNLQGFGFEQKDVRKLRGQTCACGMTVRCAELPQLAE
jgi:hypothetical protein